MNFLFDCLYLFALLCASPFLLYKSYRTGKYRSEWPARLGLVPSITTPAATRRLMIHCVSVGELLSMRHLIDRLLAADPHLFIILTTTTDTGTVRAREIFTQPAYLSRVQPCRYPLDFSFAVKAFFNRTRPSAIALVELETWPNFLRVAHSRGIPVAIINGRLTKHSLGRYKLIKPIMASMLRRLTWLGVQTQTIAARFQALGTPADRITILPTIKYDSADLSDSIPGSLQLAAALGIAPAHQPFVAGSTGPGEEYPILQMYQTLITAHPDLRLAIAPRKPESVPQVLATIRAAGLTPRLRSDHADGTIAPPLGSKEIAVLDTLGELKKLYSLAFAVFVGRSLVNLGGSDMIEVAALAKPLCFGPYTSNFTEAVELLTQAHAAIVVQSAADLVAATQYWIQNPVQAQQIATRAREVIAAQRGSTEIYVGKLLSLLNPPTSDAKRQTPNDNDQGSTS